MAAVLTCWTGLDPATQPFLAVDREGRLGATFVVGLWSKSPCDPTVEAQVRLVGDPPPSDLHGTDPLTVHVAELTAAAIAGRDALRADPRRRHAWLESVRHLADLRGPRPPGNRYFEVHVADVPRDRLLRLHVTATVRTDLAHHRAEAVLDLWSAEPGFTAADVVAVARPADETDDQGWVLMHRSGGGLDRFRLDLLTTTPADVLVGRLPLPAVSVSMGHRQVDVDARPVPRTGASATDVATVWVDRSTDSVLVTVPSSWLDGQDTVSVTTRTGTPAAATTVAPLAGERHPPVGMMIIAYAIQGLNDLFVHPATAPDGSRRSYGQLVFSDEHALFSGRPLVAENGIADGYAFALRAQRDYRVPAVWAFNAGVLLLLQHSLDPADLAELRRAVDGGWISPANAGYGAHRACYYRRETNVSEIAEGERVIAALLGRPTNGVYFGDSRIYKAAPAEVDAFAELADLVRYLVLDRSTVASGERWDHQKLVFGRAAAKVAEGTHLWRDRTGLGLLLIDNLDRDELVGADTDQVLRGQLPIDVRRHLMRSLRPADDSRPPALHVVADDVEHLSGAGWFDGGQDFATGYLAALCWINQHPWVRVWTPDDADFETVLMRRDRTLQVTSAIDATMSRRGAVDARVAHIGGQAYDVELYFDHAQQAWARFPCPWLGCTLAEVVAPLEQALATWPEEHRDDLHRTAWLYFLACTHEGFWSKQPEGSRDRLVDPYRWEPEDFVISESIQVRNAWVYLNASLWASWARAEADTAADARTFVMREDTEVASWGPLAARVRQQHSADAWWPGAAEPGRDGLFWDHDNLTNVILYNRHVLAVLDQNGGVVSQLFVIRDGRPVAVSGTAKAYQFLTLDPEVAGDGLRVQNTVLTPNHLYVGSDLLQAQPDRGTFTDQRFPLQRQPAWYANNFDRYVLEPAGPTCAVRLGYGPGDRRPDGPLTATLMADLLSADGQALRAGSPGLVWHDGPAFTKTFELVGYRLRVGCTGVRPDHVVANELTVDLLAQLTGAGPQQAVRTSHALEVTGAAGVRVRVVGEHGCHLAGAGSLPPSVREVAADLEHRVLTDTALVVPDHGASAFSYVVDLDPG